MDILKRVEALKLLIENNGDCDNLDCYYNCPIMSSPTLKICGAGKYQEKVKAEAIRILARLKKVLE